MDIIFSPKAGEIYGLFTSLYVSWNIDLLESHIEKFGINLKEELREDYYWIRKSHHKKAEKMDFFFHHESKIFKAFLVLDKIWESQSINDYIVFIDKLSHADLRKGIVKTLIDDKLKNDNERIEQLSRNKVDTLSFINELDISKGAKWDVFCFIDQMEKYRLEFINIIKDYIPHYKKLLKKNSKSINEVNAEVHEKVNLHGMKFIKAYTNNLINLDEFKNVYITNSYFDSYLIYFTLMNNTEDCYLVVGAFYHEVIGQNNKTESQLKVLKNLSDPTRFGIMKYILHDKRYGQEIALKFNISNASVSYHMNNLLLLNLVEIYKQDNKVFYQLNKDRVMETIRFLKDELCL
ncbi:ArsR/SmtB family transcription factor [Vallitalea okinawensis]|uniref:ArsR/SmtB family transcription factor n=1 Tax=Vallitalea okinawensis TaxID=2078660 RepID=UPI000CFAEF75|nr:helix-turn-helix transcriptional regulator [Vallitalea okinawensis]